MRASWTGDDVSQLRQTLDLTQAELALRLGVSTSQVRRWQRGTLEIDSHAVLRLNRLVSSKSDVQRFYRERIRVAEGQAVTATALYEDYCEWCEENRVAPLTLPTFGRDFAELGVQKAKIAGRIRFLGIARKARFQPRLLPPEDDVGRFYRERVEARDGASLTATELHEAYCRWCEENGKEPLALPTFGRDFGELGVQKAKIGGRIRFIGIALKQMPLRLEFPDLARSTTRLEVPPPRAAAIEPVWKAGRLTLARAEPETELDIKSLAAALAALRREIADLTVDCEGNIHPGAIGCLKRIADALPLEPPSQEELFRIGHWEEWLTDYASDVKAEWPAHLSSRYRAVALQFSRTIAQYPKWREFKRNALREPLSPQQVAASSMVARELAEQLQAPAASEIVDPRIPEELESLAKPLDERSPGLDPIEVGKDLLAHDVLEAVNNTLKALASRALAIGSIAGNTLGNAADGYGTKLDKAFVGWWRQQGTKDGRVLAKVLHKVMIGGAVVGGLSLGRFLIEAFPVQFDWLKSLLQVLGL